MRTALTLTLAMLCSAGVASAQRRHVAVVDAATGAPLRGATVRVRCLAGICADSASAAATDARGIAAIPFSEAVRVEVTFIGYASTIDTLERGESRRVALEPRAFEGERVVVTSQYTPTSADRSVHRVRVLDGEYIRSRSAANLGELMEGELNVRLGQDNVLGSSISIQGVSGQNVKILVDGVPVVGRVDGNIDVSQLNLADVERVEIVEGPQSVVFGTDALGGVVNIVTRRPSTVGTKGSVNLQYESVGRYNVDGTLNLTEGEFGVRLTGGRHFFDGLPFADQSRSMQWKPREQYFVELGVARPLGGVTLGYSGRYFAETILNRGELRAPYRETAFDDMYRTTRLTNTLTAAGAIVDGLTFELDAGHSRYTRRKSTTFVDLVTLEDRPTGNPSDQDTTAFASTLVRGRLIAPRLGDALSGELGIHVELNALEGGRILDGAQEIDDYGLFATAQWKPIPTVALQPGLRYVHNTKYDAPLVPSLSAMVDAGERVQVRASYGRGFRAPSIQDLHFLFVDVNHNIRGNDDLLAETSHSVNASVRYRLAGERSLLDVTPSAFYNDITNLVTLANVEGDLYSYVNVGRYRTFGLNAAARFQGEAVSAEIGASAVGRDNGLSAATGLDAFGYAYEAVARCRATIAEGVSVAAFYKYTGALPSLALDAEGSLVEGRIDAYHNLDVSVSGDLFDGAARIAIAGRNLFDVRDVRAAGADAGGTHTTGGEVSVGWGRTVAMTLSLSIGER